MHILFVGHLPPHRGGTAAVNAQLLHGLCQRGHRVTALAPVSPDQQIDANEFSIVEHGSALHHYPVPHGRPEWIRSTAEYDAAERSALAPLLGAALADRPDLLLVGHESLARHLPALAPRSLPATLIVHSAATPPLLDPSAGPGYAWLGDGIRAFDRVVAVAAALTPALAALGVAAEVIGNGVELDRFVPQRRDNASASRLGIDAGDVVVFHPSNLKPIKRPLDLVGAAALAVRRAPRLKFVVTGDGPLRDTLAATVAQAGLDAHFRFTGWVPRAEMPAMYTLADIVAMPSSGEGMALAYLETLASGRVLVASDIPASRALVSDGENALLHPVGDVAAMAAHFVTAAEDAALRARIGAAARALAARHDVEQTVDAYARMLVALPAPTRSDRTRASEATRASRTA